MDASGAIARLRRNRKLRSITIVEALTFGDAVKHCIHCSDCHFESLSTACAVFERPVHFKRCTFQHCEFYAAYFLQGLGISGCEFRTPVTFQSGGHNGKDCDVTIKDTVFHEFVDFEDCWFTGPFSIDHVEFRAGTNLLGNQDTPMQVSFDDVPVIENPVGVLDVNTYHPDVS